MNLLQEERATKQRELDEEAARELDTESLEAFIRDHREGVNTNYWRKPIPTDAADWSATREGYEPGDHIGYGRTEEEAIRDLLTYEWENFEC